MKVLLISPNREQVPDPVFPLGISFVAAGLRKAGHEVEVLDLCFSEDGHAEIGRAIGGFRPAVVGISLRNVDDVSYPREHSYLAEYRDTVDTVRKQTNALIVLGGSGFTILPEEFMNALGADYGIVGEGEEAFPELLSRIEAGAPAERVFSSRGRIQQLDACIADRSGIDLDAYYKKGGMLNVQTKRGCPFSCIYCTYPTIEGRAVRMRDPAAVADEIEAIAAQGIAHFFMVDSVFNNPPEHAKAVCDEIIRRRLDIKWSCYGHPAFMSDGLAEAMAASGCTSIEFGLDAVLDEGITIMGKSFTFQMVKEASEICRRHGIRFCHFVFVGMPGEDTDTVKRSLDRLDSLRPDAAIIMSGIRIFPGTRLADMAEEEMGMNGFGLEPVFYVSKQVLPELDRIREIITQHRNWIMPGFDVNKYLWLQRRMRSQGHKGSLWEKLGAW